MSQFLLPDLGEGLEEAQIVQWLVREGERVDLNQPICQVETAKALVDIPSPYAGTVARLHAAPGETVLVGAQLITIAEAAATTTATPVSATGDHEGHGRVLVGYGTEGPTQALARRRRVPPGTTSAGDTEPVSATAASAGDVSDTSKATLSASPLVRKMATERGIDLRTIRGTGPGGRIRVEDLERLPPQPPSGSPASRASGERLGVQDEPGDERISTIGLRKAIAARMVRAAAIPAFSEHGLFDASALVALRERLRTDPRFQNQRLTYLPFFVRALVAAVREYPIMNSRWDEEGNAIVVRLAIRVGIATDTERGLLVPVVRHAETLDLAATAAECERVATLARAGTLDAPSLTGSTITISNVGAMGPVDTGAPLINPPEACVVGFGAIKPRPTAVGDQVIVRPGAWISISCDHRIVDGATAAGFLGALVRHLEAPEGLVGGA